jgi:GNAT superfamily N-acetyltransferase
VPGAPGIPLRIRRAVPADAALLAAFGRQAFHDTFAADNRPEDMAAYLAATFGEARQRAELLDPGSTYLVAEHDDGAGADMVGYARLRTGDAPAVVRAAPAVEIARFYARRDMMGRGVGASLMVACLAQAGALGARAAWLGVWEHNTRAIAFYERWGFADVGTCEFVLGEDVQTDRIMARAIEG